MLLFASSLFAQSRYRIAGTAVDAATGTPLEQAQIVIQPVNARQQTTSVTTARDGHFSFPNLAPGKYALMAQHRGYPMQDFDAHESFSTAIAAGPGLDSENIVFRLRPEAVISGRITDEHNEPVRDANVIILRSAVVEGEETLSRVNQIRTDDRGFYRASRLTPGNYYVAVAAHVWWAQYLQPDFRRDGDMSFSPDTAALNLAYPITYFSQATDFGEADPIPLRAGDQVTANMTLRAVPAATIRYRNDSGTPNRPVGAHLTAILPSGDRVPIDNSSRGNGRVTILNGVAPGHYALDTFLPEPSESGALGRRAVQREIDIAGDMDITGLLADTIAAPRISGTVKFAAAPAARCYIQLRNNKTHFITGAPVNASGEFNLAQTPPAGTYQVFILGCGTDAYVSAVAANGAKVSGRRLEINGADPITLQLTLAYGMAQVNGVVKKDGKPLAGAMIVMMPADAQHTIEQIRRDQSDSDGTFTVPAVIPGSYILFAIDGGWDLEWKNPAVLARFAAAGQKLVVEPRSYTTALEAQSPRMLN